MICGTFGSHPKISFLTKKAKKCVTEEEYGKPSKNQIISTWKKSPTKSGKVSKNKNNFNLMAEKVLGMAHGWGFVNLCWMIWCFLWKIMRRKLRKDDIIKNYRNSQDWDNGGEKLFWRQLSKRTKVPEEANWSNTFGL